MALFVVDDDARVVARDGRIVDGDVAIIPTTDERLTECQVELLQQEAESIPGASGSIGAHLGFALRAPCATRSKSAHANLMRTSLLSSNQTKKIP